MKKLMITLLICIGSLTVNYSNANDTSLPFPSKEEIQTEVNGGVPVESSEPATSVNESVSPDATMQDPDPGINPIAEFFASITSLIMLISIVTGWIIKAAKTTGAMSQILSWVVAIGIAFIGYWKQVGIFDGADWIITLATGIGAGLVSNRLFDAGTLDNLLKFFFAKKS